MKRKFTLLIAALALLTMIVQPGRAWGQSGTLVFDFEEDSAHRTSGNNSFTSNTYSENGVTISLTYADAVTSGNPISGTANMMGRVAKNATNSPSMIIGPIDISNWNTVTSVEFKTNGPNTITEKFYVSTNGTNYTEKLSFTLNTTTATKTADELEISGDNLYLKWTGSVGSSTGSNRDFRIDDITISYTTGSSTTYTVTYNANGATSGNVPTDASSPYESGATVTVLGNTGSLAKTGHSFNNWNTNANGTGTSYSEGNTFTISSNTILFAQWTANTHNVTIPATDTYGSYEMDQTNPVAYGTEVTLTYTPASGYSGYTATWSANNTPLAGNTFTMPDEDVTVSVEVAPYEQPTTVYIDMNYQWLGSTNGGNLSPDQLPVIKIDDNVTTTITDGTSTHPRGDTDYIRIYKGSTLTFAAPDGYNITQIVFTTGGNNTWNAPSVSSGTLSDKTWTGNAESVTFDLSGSCFISMATIDLGQSSLPTPTVTIDATGITNTNVFAGTEAGSLSASVTYEETPVEGATVTWSGNNDNVATISETTGAVTLVAAGSVTFTATFAGNASYNGASKNYEMTVTNFDPDGPGTQNNPYTVAQAIENTPTSGTTGDVYIHGRVSAFYNNNTTILDDNSHRYYISDDGSTSSQLLVYNGKGLNNVAFSNDDDLLIGDEITLVGKLKTYSNAPEVDGGNYIVSLVRPSAPVATPTFNPEAGVYTEAQNVVISCETEGSTIYYTTDDTEPTNASTEYTGAISVTETTTIKAIAYVGEEYSSVATATYTIQAPLATMDEIMAAATAAGLTPTNVNINFNNWIVSGVGSNAKRAFVTDGTKGFIIYNNDGGLTFVRGNVLSGTKSCQVQLLNDAPCVKGLNASDFTITQTGQEPTVTTTTISVLEAVNTGAVVDLGNLTWDGSKFVDNYNNSIYYYNTIYAGDVLTANTIYSVKGVYVQYSGNTPPKEIAPRDANDIVATPILATADVNIACDATVGAITYTLENPVSGGTLTAAVTAGNEDNWLTLDEEIGENVPFTCTANTATTARTATVTLTYTYNTTETITATAVVTQAAYVAPVASITVTPNLVEATIEETEGYLGITYVALDITQADDFGIQFYDVNNQELNGDDEPDWIQAAPATQSGEEGYFVYYIIEENSGAERTAYFKVWALEDTEPVYSNLVTISQAEYVTPSVSIANTQLELSAVAYTIVDDFPITYQNVEVENAQSFEIQFYDANNEELQAGPNWLNIYVDGNDTDGYNVVGSVTANTGAARAAYFKVYALDSSAELIYSDLVTITQAQAVVYTITFNVNGNNDSSVDVIAGQSISLPTESASTPTPTGFEIVGWSTENSSTVAVEDPYTPTATCTLYAIMQMTDIPAYYEKVTEELEDWSGDYLLVYENENGNVAFNGSLETLDAVNNTISVTISNGRIVASNVTNAAMFTIAAMQDGYSIRNANNTYIGQTKNDNGLATSENAILNTLSYSAGNVDIVSSNAHLRYNSASNQARFRYYKSSSYTGQQAIQLYKKTTEAAPTYNTIVNVTESITILENITETELVVVASGATLTFTGTNNGNASNLIIEDGGQLVFSGTDVQATVKKRTVGEAKDDMHWYTIASPVANKAFTEVTNLVTASAYDLYRYNEGEYKWENYKSTEPVHSGFNTGDITSAFEAGRGYLYYNADGSELSFAGTLNNDEVSCNVTASHNGINLIGNPFTQNITLDNIEGTISAGGYVLNNANDWSADPNPTIQPCEGFIVEVADGQNITIQKTPSSKSRANRDYIALTVANSEYEDVTYALFSDGMGLSKINHRNADIPMLYIPQNDKNYAIATMDDNTQAFNLNFKAMSTGQYTLSFKAQGSYSYLHVIDRITGEDIDMLLDGEYTFIGSPRDNENRFIVKLNYNANIDELEAGDSFAYQYGNGIIVNGKGELQVFDVNGRMVMNTVINGKQTVNIPTTGLYIFRMVGESVKTQKIVVR